MTTTIEDEEVADLVEMVCLYCNKKIYVDPALRTYHNFCSEHCEDRWRDMYGELVDNITTNP